MHGVQSGVALKMNHDGGPVSGETSPKHLRTGVNAAMVEHSALTKLLIDKGVITVDEYQAELADSAERERLLYEQWADRHHGRAPGTFTLA